MSVIEMTPYGDLEGWAERLTREAPQPCYLLNRELRPNQIGYMVRFYHLYEIPFEGEDRFILLAGVYKPDAVHASSFSERFYTFVDGQEACDMGESISREGIVLEETLTKAQRERVHEIFEIEEVVIDGRSRERIRLVWHSVISDRYGG